MSETCILESHKSHSSPNDPSRLRIEVLDPVCGHPSAAKEITFRSVPEKNVSILRKISINGLSSHPGADLVSLKIDDVVLRMGTDQLAPFD